MERIYNLAQGTGHLAKLIVFGSFVTAKSEPNDVDVFMLMENTFKVSDVTGATAIIFDHLAAQSAEGASLFWIKRAAAIGGEEEALADWQVKRGGGGKRGIVEVIRDDQKQ